MERETLIVTILNISLSVLGFIVLLSNPIAKDFFLIYVLSSAISALVAVIITGNVFAYIFTGFKKKIAIEIFKNGWPIGLAGIFGTIMLNIDIFILGLYRSTAEIGFYSAGQKIVQVLYLLPTLLASGVLPTLAYIIKKGSKEQEKKLNEKSIGAVLLFTIPMVVGGVVLADPIFKLLFGHEYVEGIPAFIILLFSTLILFPGIMIANLVLVHNQQKRILKFTIISSIINVVLNFILIPQIGIIGAASSALCTQIMNYGITWYEMKKVNDFKILPKMKKVVLGSLTMGVISLLLNALGIYVLLNILISAISYFSILWILKEEILIETRDLVKNSVGAKVGM